MQDVGNEAEEKRMKVDQVEFEVVEVTPEMATEWLKSNKSNRNVRQRTVSQYAEDMRAARWRLNGDAIRFNGNGSLHDGQHRLYACVEAGKSFTTLVVRGLTDADHVTLDVGIKRTFADTLKWKGEADCNHLGAAIRAAYMYQKYENPLKARLHTPSHQELLKFLNKNPEIRAAVGEAGRLRRVLRVPVASIAVLHFYGSRTAPEDTADFFAKLHTPVGLYEGSPILALRRWLDLRAGERGKPRTEVYTAMVIKAFNLYRAGEEIELLVWRGGGARPVPYPRIEESDYSVPEQAA